MESASKPDCFVVHRPTESLARVLRWMSEDSIMLLEPLIIADDQGWWADNGSGTMWSFEKDVIFVDKPKSASGVRAAGPIKPNATAQPTSAATRIEMPNDSDTTRRAGGGSSEETFQQLDPRFAVKETELPGRGRGIFALQDVRAGTHVMRARPAAAVVKPASRSKICACCHDGVRKRGHKNVVPPLSCAKCGSVFCKNCTDSEGFAKSAGSKLHAHACSFLMALATVPVLNKTEADPELLHLVADCLARRTRGLINDEQWEEINELEGGDAGGGVKGLSDRGLRDVRLRLEKLMGFDVSEEDVQTMYCRMARNLHPFSSPSNALGPDTASGLFPTAALVNHSCCPNACFRADVRRPVDKGLATIEYVLGTMLDVHAGEEICISYLKDSCLEGLEVRRRALEGSWGFVCECSRCQEETKEVSRTSYSAVDQEASMLLCKIEDMLQGQARDRNVLPHRKAAEGRENDTEDDGGEAAASVVFSALQFMAIQENALSNYLYLNLAGNVLAATKALGLTEERALDGAYMHAGNAIRNAGLRDPYTFLIRYEHSKVARALATLTHGRPQELIHLTVCVMCLKEAAETACNCFGEEHVVTEQARKEYDLRRNERREVQQRASAARSRGLLSRETNV